MTFFFQRGSPLFAEPRHVNRPSVAAPERYLPMVEEILRSRWLTNDGRFVRELEKELAARHEVRHAIACCNATIALQIVLKAAGIQGEVIVPAMTFIATAHAADWLGLRPVFCDVRADALTIDPSDVRRRITKATSAIFAVNLFSQPCDFADLDAIARESNLELFYDSAHCFGSQVGGRPFGSRGKAEILSFHATKIFNTFEGGAILTNDGDFAAQCRLMRNFGFSGYDAVDSAGTNGKMNEVNAAHGLALLDDIPGLIKRNRTHRLRYESLLESIPGISFMKYPDGVDANDHYVIAFIDESKFNLSRAVLYRLLWGENVLARRYFYPGCHRCEPYASDPAFKSPALPVTEKVLDEIICLPTGNAVSLEDIQAIANLIRAAYENADVVRDWAAKK